MMTAIRCPSCKHRLPDEPVMACPWCSAPVEPEKPEVVFADVPATVFQPEDESHSDGLGESAMPTVRELGELAGLLFQVFLALCGAVVLLLIVGGVGYTYGATACICILMLIVLIGIWWQLQTILEVLKQRSHDGEKSSEG